jgi:hypothetical protein
MTLVGNNGVGMHACLNSVAEFTTLLYRSSRDNSEGTCDADSHADTFVAGKN